MRWLWKLAVPACLILAACAGGNADESDSGQHRGFYGGVSSGTTTP